MKKINAILLAVLIVLLAFAGVFYFGGTLSSDARVISASAVEYPDAFASIRGLLSKGAVPQVFVNEVPDAPDGCALLDVSVTLTNRGLFDAEWVNLKVRGAEGDIAVYSLTGEGATVPAHGTQTVNFKLITRGSVESRRVVTLQYYVYGLSRTVSFSI